MSFTFAWWNTCEVHFAFSYPYPYERCIKLVRELDATYSNDKEIYFKQEVLTYSPENRIIHLLTISS